ncbi:hypothetical protein LDENG_00017090 [Lucifuga dentata]|nr:hypothetical protein LDENG_00017090 [Lucifuga dentata]
MNVLMLLIKVLQSSSAWTSDDVAFPRVVPSGLQLFEYESLWLTCEGFDEDAGWSVMRKINGRTAACSARWGTLKDSFCFIKHASPEDSGRYWCETRDGKRSNNVSIIITGTFKGPYCRF